MGKIKDIITENEELKLELNRTRQAVSFMSLQGWGTSMSHDEVDNYVQEVDETIRNMANTEEVEK